MKKLYIFFTFSLTNLSYCFAQIPGSSNLPFIFINTDALQIRDEPKVKAEMKIIYNGGGKRNNSTDAPNHYDGFVGIEVRGSSSQMFPKKGYGIELWNEKGEEREESLFGMPKESDWVLFASYNEKSFMHNVLTMKLAREMGMYASRTQYVEVILNGQYIGVYVFEEKIKRATGRVDIAKLKETDLKGDDITGGYIFKADKNTGNNIGGWYSQQFNYSAGINRTYYLYEAPKTIMSEQKAYLSKYVDEAEKVLKENNFQDKINGFRKYFDTRSFIKMFLVNEVSKNVDGYRISSYFYKDKDSKGGKIKAGPPWDYDISYGNGNYCSGDTYTGFAYKFNDICSGDSWQVPFWWDRMLQDTAYVRELGEEYSFQRKQGALQLDRIYKHIDSLVIQLKEPIVRNFQKWPILGVYVWPQPTPISQSWEGEVEELRRFIALRLNWLDANIKAPPGPITSSELSGDARVLSMEAFPNPFFDRISVTIHSAKAEKAKLSLVDMNGHIIEQIDGVLQVGENVVMIQAPNSQQFAGIKLLQLESNGRKITKKIVQQ